MCKSLELEGQTTDEVDKGIVVPPVTMLPVPGNEISSVSRRVFVTGDS